MAEQTTETDPNAQTGAQTDPPETNDGTGKPAETKAEPKEPTKVEELPEFARKMISDLRDEAAKHRGKAKEAKDAARVELEAEYAPIRAEVLQLKAQLESERLNGWKRDAAVKLGIDAERVADFADLLKGTTQEEIEEHAQKVKELFGGTATSSAVDPTQGRRGSSEPDVGTGIGRLTYAYSQKPKR